MLIYLGPLSNIVLVFPLMAFKKKGTLNGIVKTSQYIISHNITGQLWGVVDYITGTPRQ